MLPFHVFKCHPSTMGCMDLCNKTASSVYHEKKKIAKYFAVLLDSSLTHPCSTWTLHWPFPRPSVKCIGSLATEVTAASSRGPVQKISMFVNDVQVILIDLRCLMFQPVSVFMVLIRSLYHVQYCCQLNMLRGYSSTGLWLQWRGWGWGWGRVNMAMVLLSVSWRHTLH